MPVDSLSNDMAALLRVLEQFEHSLDERPISTLRQLAELHDEAESELTDPTGAADRSGNPFVERIATAMTKLRVQGG